MSASKSAEAFRTISEASKELGVPQHVLRHWEDVFGHIRPMRRAGGRRYYRPVDLDLLRGVRVLLYDERYTTKGVQKIFRENGVKYISEIGREQNDDGELNDKVPSLQGQSKSKVEYTKSEKVTVEQAPKRGVSSAGAAPDVAQISDPLRSSEGKKHLTQLIAKLEHIQDALDETVLAIEAISINSQENETALGGDEVIETPVIITGE